MATADVPPAEIPHGWYWRRHGRAGVPLLVGAVGLAGLVGVQLGPVRHAAQGDLANRSRTALVEAGLGGVTIGVTGQDAHLSGRAASAEDAARALYVVRHVPGVRTVTARIAVTPSAPVAAPVTVPAAAPTPAAGPAPASAEVITVQRQLNALPQIAFTSVGTDPTPAGAAVVQQAAGILAAAPGLQITVIGYTDDVGDWDRNLVRSRERAASVTRLLVAAGIAPGRITTIGLSEERPKAPNTSEEGRALNRRAELFVR